MPYLTCDPQPNTTRFEVEVDGIIAPSECKYNAMDMAYVHCNLGDLDDGNHTIVARAGNVWGVSENSVPFDFTKGFPGAPSGFGLLDD